MGYPDDFGDEPGMRGTFEGLWQRYQAQVVELRANQQQWRASWQHYGTTGSVWGLVLMNARLGLLAPDWRDTLSPEAHYAAGFPRPTDPAMLDADALAIYEVATAPPAAWEPHATGGDWRHALTAWKVDAEDLHRHQFRTKRWLSDLTTGKADDRQTQAHMNAVLEARTLDAIEASYRAGLAAGGDDEDWRGWYRRRITETWSTDDDSTYKLYYSAERIGSRLDSGTPVIKGGDMINIQEQLPQYWREGEPQP